MIDEFVAAIKNEYTPWSPNSLRRILDGTVLPGGSESKLDIYSCAWYIVFMTSAAGLSPAIESYLHITFSKIPKVPLTNQESLQAMCRHLKNDMEGYRGPSNTWDHAKIDPNDVVRVCMQLVNGKPFEFNGWVTKSIGSSFKYMPIGLFADTFLDMKYMSKHASNVGIILNWDASFIDVDHNKYRLMVINRWDEIIGRLINRFGNANKSLPRYCYGFNDFYLLRPVAVSLIRKKKVPDDVFKWFALWHFRRVWDNTPSDQLFMQAVCENWESIREVLYQEGYKRNHLFNLIMRMLHIFKTIPLTREQLGNIYPSLIKAAIKGNDQYAATYVQSL